MENYNGNGIWIPYEILHNTELSPAEKILYAEIYYLDNPEFHCIASNETLAKLCSIPESTLRKHLTHLKVLGLIEQASFDGRQRALKVCVKWYKEGAQNEQSACDNMSTLTATKNESLLIKENIKENIKEKTPAKQVSPSSTHTRNFRKENEKLTDDLSSGEEIKKQTAQKKKQSKEEKCIALIKDTTYSPDTQKLLIDYFTWNYHSDNVKRIKSLSDLKQKLNRLDQLIKKGFEAEKIVQCALDNQWYGFFEPTETKEKKYDSPGVPSDGVISQTLHGDEVKAELARRTEVFL